MQFIKQEIPQNLKYMLILSGDDQPACIPSHTQKTLSINEHKLYDFTTFSK